jgi:hypothetical protein
MRTSENPVREKFDRSPLGCVAPFLQESPVGPLSREGEAPVGEEEAVVLLVVAKLGEANRHERLAYLFIAGIFMVVAAVAWYSLAFEVGPFG